MASGEKEKKPKSITPQGSATYIGNQMTSNTVYNPATGQMETHYYESPEEQARKTAVQGRINSIIPTLGQTAPEMSAQWDSMAKAYEDQNVDAFNRMYDPTLRNLREDVASRFGTTKASDYYDRLNDLEKNVKTPALLDIARSATQMKSGLYDQQEANKLKELQSLGYFLNNDQQNFLSNLTNTQNSANSLNQFNLSKYSQDLQQYNADLNRAAQNSWVNQYAKYMGANSQVAGGFI